MRLYSYGYADPSDEESNNYLLQILGHANKLKMVVDENKYGRFTVVLCNKLRKELNLPNKICSLVSYSKHQNENILYARILLFDKEPNGKYYNVFLDENNNPYIEVE